MEENARVPESERLQMAQILELDMEELQVEEVDDDFEASDNGGDDDDALFRFLSRAAWLLRSRVSIWERGGLDSEL